MREYLRNIWIRIGLGLVIFGWGPLLAVALLAAVGLWPDRHPNPIGLGLLFFVTFWPALICLAIGVVQQLRRRHRQDRDPPGGQSHDPARPDPPLPDRAAAEMDWRGWLENPLVRMAGGVGGVLLIVLGAKALGTSEDHAGAGAMVLGAAVIYWAIAGHMPFWFRH